MCRSCCGKAQGKNQRKLLKETLESLKETLESLKETLESLKETLESLKETLESLKETLESLKETFSFTERDFRLDGSQSGDQCHSGGAITHARERTGRQRTDVRGLPPLLTHGDCR